MREAEGADGQAGRALDWLRSIAPDARALKTALAVGLAWWIGMLLGNERPIFAAFGALVGMQATVDRSLRRIGVRLAGMLGGLVLAFVVVRLFGAGAFGIGFAVLLGLWLSRQAGAPKQVGVELGITTLLLIGLASGDPAFAIDRIWETVVGALVAGAINVLVLPPDYLDEVADDLHDLVATTASGLRRATRVFVQSPDSAEGPAAEDTQQRLGNARNSLPRVEARLELAESALRFSPLVWDRGPRLERYRAGVALAGQAVRHATNVARAAGQHAERPYAWGHNGPDAPDHLVRGADALALGLERYEAYVRTGADPLLGEVRREAGRARASLAEFVATVDRERAGESDTQRLVDIAAAASELEHLAADLADAVGEASPSSKPETSGADRPPEHVPSNQPSAAQSGAREEIRR